MSQRPADLALFAAIERADADAVSAAIAAGADVNAIDRFEIVVDRDRIPAQRTPLVAAVATGNEAIVRCLLGHPGIDLAIDDGFGRTPLMLAAERGFASIAAALIEVGAMATELDREGRSALFLAVQNREAELAMTLLRAGPPSDVGAVLVDACFRGMTPLVRHLLSLGAAIGAVNRAGTTPLAGAAWGGQDDVVKLLIEHGADLAADGKKALDMAANAGRTSTVRLLVGLGVPVDGWGAGYWTPLISAAWQGQTQTVEALLELGADRSLDDGTGKTALDWARTGERHDIVALLS